MTATCGICGAIFRDDAPAFCGSCGSPLNSEKQEKRGAAAPAAPFAAPAPPPAPPAGAPGSAPSATIPEAPLSSALVPLETSGAAVPEPAPPAGAPRDKGALKGKHLAPGTLIDKKYAVLRVLGEGGMGVVYLARDIHTGLDVVVKAVRTELAHRNDVRARTLAEGRALAQIDHPNVVHLRAVAVEGPSLFLVMQYIDGESLDKMIGRYVARGERMPLEEALGVFRQIAAGVGAAHEEGVIHRDLKPANVIVRKKDRVAKVTDFGIALVPTDTSRPQTKGILGSLWYMSPEQVIGRRDLDHRIDVYALGIMLYQMLVGRVPFDAKSDYEIMKLQAEAPMPRASASRPDVPAAVDEIILKACAKSRDDRFQRCEEIVAAVDRAMAAPLGTPASSVRAPVQAPPGPTPPIPLVTHAVPVPDPVGPTVDPEPEPPREPEPKPEPKPEPELAERAAQEPVAAEVSADEAAEAPNEGAEPAAEEPDGTAGEDGEAAAKEAATDAKPEPSSRAAVVPVRRNPRSGRRAFWAGVALLVVLALAAGAIAAFGLVPGVPGVPALAALAGRGRRKPPPPSPTPTASTSATPQAPTAPIPKNVLDALVGSWVGHGRELEAVINGGDLEFRVKRPEQFPLQGYEAGEPRFVLHATSEPNVFTVDDHLRPQPPTGKMYDPRARASCREVWTAVGGDPLRARFDASKLSVEFAKIEPTPANFTLENGKVVSCSGLRDAKATKIKNTLSRP